MSDKITKEKMLEAINSFEINYGNIFKEELKALRALIKKVFEWQEKADSIWELSPTIEGFVDDVPLKKLIKEIRDFGRGER